MSRYYRLYLGKHNMYATECHDGNFIGADFDIRQNLTSELPDNWRDFNKKFISVLRSQDSTRSNQSAGLACGMLWTVARGFSVGGIVICPTGSGGYYVGRVTSNYYYVPDGILPHRRDVEWLPLILEKSAMSEPMQRSVSTPVTVCDITQYSEEVERLIEPASGVQLTASDPSIENPTVFALEKYLEDFLVTNWENTTFGANYRIYEVDGERVGQQYMTDTGPLDILAQSKDGKEYLVLELKKGRASDNVVGQILRYMGFVQEVIAEAGQSVRGAIVALDDDLSIKRALSMTTGIDFYRYEVKFTLNKT